jgi:hypothetical protein
MSRPDSEICVVNAPAKHMKCYNLLEDYDGEGNLKTDASPLYRPALVVEDLNKYIVIDSEKSFENLKIWINEMKMECNK